MTETEILAKLLHLKETQIMELSLIVAHTYLQYGQYGSGASQDPDDPVYLVSARYYV